MTELERAMRVAAKGNTEFSGLIEDAEAERKHQQEIDAANKKLRREEQDRRYREARAKHAEMNRQKNIYKYTYHYDKYSLQVGIIFARDTGEATIKAKTYLDIPGGHHFDPVQLSLEQVDLSDDVVEIGAFYD
jgi:hypothetical protein